MLKFKVFASSIPLLLAGIFARSELMPDVRPCIAFDETSVQIASASWQAQTHVSFTDDPQAATVRVQIVDSAEAADFVVVDDTRSAEVGACGLNAPTRFIGITASPTPAQPVIYLSRNDGANYRIFVQSRTFTPLDAAALIVGASTDRLHVAASL